MEINGHTLKCPHCNGEEFERGAALLNTAMMSLLDLDWLNKEAVTFKCKTCHRVEWFTHVEKELPEIVHEVVAKTLENRDDAILSDAEFMKWRQSNPEMENRDLVDQIALYRDFQNGR